MLTTEFIPGLRCAHRLRGLVFMLCLWSLCGCDGFKSVRVDNPVVGPPPPRVDTQHDLDIDQQNYASLNPVAMNVSTRGNTHGNIVQTDAVSGIDRVQKIEEAQIVATVNGTAILAATVLEPFKRPLQKFKKVASPKEYEAQRRKLLKQQLPVVIEQQMLIEGLKSKVSPDQLKSFDEQLDEGFAEHVKSMLKQTRSANAEELEQKLQAQGTSLEKLRKAFGKKQMAVFYLFDEAKTNQVLSRSDLRDYYKSHLKEYENPARAKWREITISYAKHNGKSGAAQIVKTIINQLRQGNDFAALAKEHSDGATASNGGLWDWTLKESLADENIGSLLFTLPVGQISDVYIGKKNFKLVKVVEREEAFVTPLSEIQEDIKKKIEDTTRDEKTKAVIDNLKKTFVIRTMFDNEK